IGVLCQLECEAPFRAEMLRWMPGYADPPTAAPPPETASAQLAPETESAQPVRPAWPAGSAQPAPRAESPRPARSARPAERDQITWPQVKWEDIMAKLPRPQAPAIFRAMFPDLADW